MKAKCPLCSTELEFGNDTEEGDFISCEECGELLTAEVKSGQIRLVTEQQKKFEEMEEIEEEIEYEEEE
ncbi:MAG: hypothetical protein COV47_05795 [Candidatus Diapherotrites archaeon CG11_big_fil_rev_8_21_14_0_20_37_9]|nr:MAG: hypothetical protein COV47_05795 [Candidatus Diapherotrites archaeon CG11_big_fil_rev_8_21_14_0_20_37_9]